jgi:CRP-like cAMP-binding protein
MVDSNRKPSIDLLKEIKLLQCFTDQELENLLRVGSIATYEPHSNIVIEGELSWGLYLILEGTVGIYKLNKLKGTEYDIGQLTQGGFFGEMSLIDDNPRSATVKTIVESQLFYIAKDSFLNLLESSSGLKIRFYQSCIQNLVVRLRELDDNYVISQYQLWHTALKKEEEKK